MRTNHINAEHSTTDLQLRITEPKLNNSEDSKSRRKLIVEQRLRKGVFNI